MFTHHPNSSYSKLNLSAPYPILPQSISLFWLTWQQPHHFRIKLGIISNFMSSFRESRVLRECALQSDNSGSNTDSTKQVISTNWSLSLFIGNTGITKSTLQHYFSTGPEILNECKVFRFLLFKVEQSLKICLIFNPRHGVSKSI